MRHLCFILIALCTINITSQEKYLAKNGLISFYSHALVEDIEAYNNQVLSILNLENSAIEIQLLMRSFLFEKALMREHFNENYIESHKFPKATFKGTVNNLNGLQDKPTRKEINGILQVHGREKEITVQAKISKSKKEILLTGQFTVEVSDFDIKIPMAVVNNISKTIIVNFEFHYKPYTP